MGSDAGDGLDVEREMVPKRVMGLLRPIVSLALINTSQQDPDSIQRAYCESNTRWVSRRLRLALVARRRAKVLRLVGLSQNCNEVLRLG